MHVLIVSFKLKSALSALNDLERGDDVYTTVKAVLLEENPEVVVQGGELNVVCNLFIETLSFIEVLFKTDQCKFQLSKKMKILKQT